jgi:hypothetical protein
MPLYKTEAGVVSRSQLERQERAAPGRESVVCHQQQPLFISLWSSLGLRSCCRQIRVVYRGF